MDWTFSLRASAPYLEVSLNSPMSEHGFFFSVVLLLSPLRFLLPSSLE